MLIPRSVVCIEKFCDPDSARYALSAVRVEQEQEDCRAVATDGRRLIVAEWRDQEYEDFPLVKGVDPSPPAGRMGALIPRSVWKEVGSLLAKVRSAARAKPIFGRAAMDREANGEARFAVTDGETVRTVETRTLEGRFPKWRDVIPSDHGVMVRVKAKYLAEALLTAAEAAETGCVTLRAPRHEGGMVVVEAAGDRVRATAVVAPLTKEE